MTTDKTHQIQKQILHTLSAARLGLRFNQLLTLQIESELLNYHLKKLCELEFVTKQDSNYCLTTTGKDYFSRFDDTTLTIEKQPKVGVIVDLQYKDKNGVVQVLLNRRLKHPYYGKVGRITGKSRFGETFIQAAKRELFEEANLVATRLQVVSIYHKVRHDQNGLPVQDNVFAIVKVLAFRGKLQSKTINEEVFFVPLEELKKNLHNYDVYDDFAQVINMGKTAKSAITESVGVQSGF